MTSLLDLIKSHIAQHGPMTVQDYWALCLSHPQYGYYIKQDPLGRGGDFTTAPEISQVFGEMIGIWAADLWIKLGKPERFILAECGAGRGTMMDDLLRATGNLPGFVEAAEIHIVEISPHLVAVQKQRLSQYNVKWVSTIDDIPMDYPLILLGNEFLDALPIRQMVRTKNGWAERLIGLENDALTFGIGTQVPASDEFDAPEGKIFEVSPARDSVMQQIATRLKMQDGGALLIDYGHLQTSLGDTFQAVKDHQYVDVLATPGDADLTSHVDFARLAMLSEGLTVQMETQGEFLKNMGAILRTDSLLKNATKAQADALRSGLERLIAPDQMGQLFKVIAVTSGIEPAGF